MTSQRITVKDRLGIPTCMDADPQPEWHIREVTDPELSTSTENLQRHGTDLTGVSVTVLLWQTASHHVGVSDSFHLKVRPLVAELGLSKNNIVGLPR